ncbi:hypothetical protein Salat_0208000 [Sesamum alatum]|uniref:Uncharacterized protein n=1 Tax=Sesamum alatum TaxID=300844 RepID=A0AAE1YYD3_9LAMI|nr:hypothetical protein Salat_0208000 [Sesamum alatum]
MVAVTVASSEPRTRRQLEAMPRSGRLGALASSSIPRSGRESRCSTRRSEPPLPGRGLPRSGWRPSPDRALSRAIALRALPRPGACAIEFPLVDSSSHAKNDVHLYLVQYSPNHIMTFM